MRVSYDFDIVVMGSGPGGYTAAIRCGQLGKSVAVIEKEKLGGVCLNVGCIPAKALIHEAAVYRSRAGLEKQGIAVATSGFDYGRVFSASRRAADTLSRGVAYLLKKNGISVINGVGRLLSPHEVAIDNARRTISAANIIVATGSRPFELPGFEFDGKVVLSSTDVLMLEQLPKKLCVLGAGAIGVEFSHFMSAFGVEVHLVELLDRILPLEDEDVSKTVRLSFVKRGVSVYTSARAVSLKRDGGGAAITLKNNDSTLFDLEADKVLVAAGRVPNTGDLGLERLGITMEKGFITVGDYGQTGVPGIYAIGDTVATPLLAHVASKEGEMAAEHIAGKPSVSRRIDPLEIPNAIYCEPEVASFGLTRQQAREKGIDCSASVFPFRASGMAVATGDTEGFVKIVHDREEKKLLGAHIAGHHAAELIHELLLAKTCRMPLEAVARMIHAHPTLSESVMEAAKMAGGRAIHL